MERAKKWDELTERVFSLCKQGLLSRAASVAEEALEFAENTFEADHPNIAQSLDNMAQINYSLGRHAEKLLFEQTLFGMEKEAPRADLNDCQPSLENIVLSNVAKHKYAEAEYLFKRALQIKAKTLLPDHPQIAESQRNIAELYESQGKYSQSESLLRSIQARWLTPSRSLDPLGAASNGRDPTESKERRRECRFPAEFPVRLSSIGMVSPVSGVTKNLSHRAVFVKTKDWQSFKIGDEVVVTIFVPSPCSAQDADIGLRSLAQVTRIDEENEGLVVGFVSQLTDNAPFEQFEIAGNVRYKKLAHYLSTLENTGLSEFTEEHPTGFFVERSKCILDQDVVFQFGTQQVDLRHGFDLLENGSPQTSVLEARVIEIKKRKAGTPSGVIRIGRSADNDIVLYNKMVSKSHACLFLGTGDKIPYLVDPGSTNCTFLNQEKAAPCKMYQVKDGDEISFGPETKMIYMSAQGFYYFLSRIENRPSPEVDS
ncbi:MAG: tetratricopeptide repeat protein [Deltaproteobacteria bacterium]|nr:MAG: tetratricopeptide repeat protein [Deltaproteobacteria bacterium]